MFEGISVFHFLIYAAGIGFAAAIVYTNIQRTTLSRFINFLIDNNCLDEDSSLSLDDIGFKPSNKRIIKSALKSHHGFRRSIGVINDNQNGEDTFFENTNNSKYYLLEHDTEALKKKYSFKTMPTRLVILFIAALVAVVIISSALVSWLIETVSTPKIKDNEDTDKTEQTDNVDDDASDSSVSDNLYDDFTDFEESETDGPRIPI